MMLNTSLSLSSTHCFPEGKQCKRGVAHPRTSDFQVIHISSYLHCVTLHEPRNLRPIAVESNLGTIILYNRYLYAFNGQNLGRPKDF